MNKRFHGTLSDFEDALEEKLGEDSQVMSSEETLIDESDNLGVKLEEQIEKICEKIENLLYTNYGVEADIVGTVDPNTKSEDIEYVTFEDLNDLDGVTDIELEVCFVYSKSTNRLTITNKGELIDDFIDNYVYELGL